ncbi:nitrogen fixation protein NifQ [Mongoliimonas terrestris]|uniref:nitrogen fixation protein NifQ n=1 Tax=Mongoliimonas terrestris TaxID=1709001 RepID=UPI00094987CE|nr:nitrogen fixation protein NifQ [Mongoliimonas terrestris]
MRIFAPYDGGPSSGTPHGVGREVGSDGSFALAPILADAFTRILLLAAEETARTGESIGRRTGLSGDDLRSIGARLPHGSAVIGDDAATSGDDAATVAEQRGYKAASSHDKGATNDDILSSVAAGDEDEEEAQVRLLLHRHRAADTDDLTRLARVVARRAMEPNHLWQDLGLASRADLKALLEFAFPDLAARNTTAMRWKKFFYRQLCEAEGFVLCSAPSCGVCRDFADCFGPEDGETMLATLRRAAVATA